MTTVEKNLLDAQEALRRAEQDVERWKKAPEQLKKIRADGRRLSAELEQAVAGVREADAAFATAERDITERNNAINKFRAARPQNFPSDGDFAAWERKLQKLTADRDEAGSRKRAAEKTGGELRLKAIRLEGEVTRLRNSEMQFEALAQGEVPGKDWLPKSGISSVA